MEREPIQDVRVPGMVSKPPETRERQMEDTSTFESFVVRSLRIAEAMQGLSVPFAIISRTWFRREVR